MCRGWVAAARRGSPELGTVVAVFAIQDGCGVLGCGTGLGGWRAGCVLSCERGGGVSLTQEMSGVPGLGWGGAPRES